MLRNGWSLFGLAQSLTAQGKTDEAAEVQKQFEDAWQYADVILARLQMPDGGAASVLWQASEMATGRHPNSLTFYGSKGSLHLGGYFFPETIEHFDRAQQCWQEMQIPDAVSSMLAWTEDPAQSAWHQFIDEFVADVRGQEYAGYPTFREGRLANAIIDIVRSERSWTAMPAWSIA